jgi:hypothetical protein
MSVDGSEIATESTNALVVATLIGVHFDKADYEYLEHLKNQLFLVVMQEIVQ